MKSWIEWYKDFRETHPTMSSLISFLKGLLIGLIVTWLFCASMRPAQAANEYLNSYGQHCSSATLDPYIEYNVDESSNNDNYKSDTNRGTVGIRLSIPLGTTCTKEYKETIIKNELLRQQLEMLKMCARYKDLDLGPEFAEVKEMCAGVNKKRTKETN